jgi:hypothetical protein
MPQVYVGEDGSGDVLSTGDGTVTRSVGVGVAVATVATGSGNLILAQFNAKRGTPSTQVRVLSGTTAAGATPTLCRIGLYAVALNSQNVLTGTLVASTVNDTTLFAAASTAYARSWSAAVTPTLGARYALGVLVVTGAAAPTLVGESFLVASESAQPPRLGGSLAGQSDLPATWVDSALTASGSRFYGVIL